MSRSLGVLLRVARLAVLPALASLPLACSSGVGRTATSEPASGDFLAANMDRSVDPAVDFFDYVQEQLYLSLRRINEQSAAGTTRVGSDQQKIGDFWTTAMDTTKAERLGIHPLEAELARIEAIRNSSEALDVAFAMQPLGVGAFFGFYVGQDEKASSQMAVHPVQGGLGLPDRDYYVNPDSGVARTRDEYVAHLARIW